MDGNLAVKYAVLENGEIVNMARATVEHNLAVAELRDRMRAVVQKPCTVYQEQSYRWEADFAAYRIPDLSVCCDRTSKNGIDLSGIPWFVLEGLSESTWAVDLTEKKALYGSIGVAEYWILDFKNKVLERFKNARGEFQKEDVLSFEALVVMEWLGFLTKPEIQFDISGLFREVKEEMILYHRW